MVITQLGNIINEEVNRYCRGDADAYHGPRPIRQPIAPRVYLAERWQNLVKQQRKVLVVLGTVVLNALPDSHTPLGRRWFGAGAVGAALGGTNVEQHPPFVAQRDPFPATRFADDTGIWAVVMRHIMRTPRRGVFFFDGAD